MGGGGEVLGQVGAPKAALMKRAALACARLARASSSTVSESVALCMRRASSAKRSSAASHTSIVVPLTAGTILEPTSTRLDDVLSRAWATRPCNTARKPLCSRVEVSWMSAHSTGAGEGEGGIDGGCGILGGAGGRGFGGGGLGKGGGDEGGGGPSGGKLSVGGGREGGGGGGGG